MPSGQHLVMAEYKRYEAALIELAQFAARSRRDLADVGAQYDLDRSQCKCHTAYEQV